MAPSESTTPPFMSTEPEPTSFSPARVSGRCSSWETTVSRWPSSRMRPVPVPRRRASRSGAWPALEHGIRSTSASSGSSAAHTAAHSSAPCTSPEGEETATSASRWRTARRAISSAPSRTHGSMAPCTLLASMRCPSFPRWRSPPAGSARRSRGADRVGDDAGAERAQDVRPAAARASTAATFTGVKRRGKLLFIDLATPDGEPLTLLTHLMSAGRMQLYAKRASMRDRTSRVLLRMSEDRELRLREFGTKQAAWVKLLRPEALEAEAVAEDARAGGVALAAGEPRRAARLAAAAALAAARPAGDRRHRAHLGRRHPARGPAVAVQARRRPLRGGGRRAARGDRLRAGPRDRRLRGQGPAPAPREVPQADARARPPGRAVPALRDDARGRLLRGLRDDVLPRVPDRRAASSRTAGSRACSNECA